MARLVIVDDDQKLVDLLKNYLLENTITSPRTPDLKNFSNRNLISMIW